MADRGRDVSPALTEVRTVLNRAETALVELRDHWHRDDPDVDEMVDVLEVVVAALIQWRKTGPPPKCPKCKGTLSSYSVSHWDGQCPVDKFPEAWAKK